MNSHVYRISIYNKVYTKKGTKKSILEHWTSVLRYFVLCILKYS